MQSLRILMADDNPAFLSAVRGLLDKQFITAASLGTGEAVLREVPELDPDVILLDISMGDLDGLEVARRLRDMGCRAKIIMVSIHEGLEFVRAALAAGASGYVFKSRVNSDLIPAIDASCMGKLFVSSRLLETIINY